MAPNVRVAKAFRAMKKLGVTEDIVKPVLKDLLNLYQKNWTFIEEDNYRALVEAIFEKEEGQAVQPEKKSQNVDASATTKKKRRSADVEVAEAENKHWNIDPEQGNSEVREHPDRPLKRSCLRSQENHVSTSPSCSDPRLGVSSKQVSLQKVDNSLALLKPKDEPPTDDLLPLEDSILEERRDERSEFGNIIDESSSKLEIASIASGKVKISMSCVPPQGRSDFHVPSLEELFKRTEDKCLRSYKFLDPSFSVRKILNELCECALDLGTPRIIESQEATIVPSSDDISSKYTAAVAEVVNTIDVGRMEQPEVTSLPPTSNGMGQSPQSAKGFTGKKSSIDKDNEQSGMKNREKLPTVFHIPDVAQVEQSEVLYLPPTSNGMGQSPQPANGFTGVDKDNEHSDMENANSHSLIVVEHLAMMPFETQPPIYVVNDISKGLESIIISLVNEVNNDPAPAFRYIPSNVKFENADVSFSLARIGDSCCSTCIGNCTSNSCACARATGAVVYTKEGLIKEDFLEECMSLNRDSRKQSLSYCKDCPLERTKEEDAKEGCKGHLVRQFIKECWWKCGCNGLCGNRVVQRGIKRSLQVFMTPQGKGWGLRTLEDLPKGAFVCEFVGEILTNKEFYTRISESSSKHELPVLLDADWSARVIKDEEALCLDAVCYGNVARFINHRCFDANLIGIPVEVDTPERHYYRFAFFTTRNVDAFEELTRDYGIDFDDHGNEFKTFECLCESKFCRNLRRMTRSRSGKRRK